MSNLIIFILIMLTSGYLYRIIINSCKHEWEQVKEITKVGWDSNENKYEYTQYHLKCKKCGNIKKKNM
jgi:hypothetical protein